MKARVGESKVVGKASEERMKEMKGVVVRSR